MYRLRKMHPLDALAIVFAAVVVLLSATGWLIFYVQPRQAFLNEVTECVGPDASEAAWKRCADQVRSEVVRG